MDLSRADVPHLRDIPPGGWAVFRNEPLEDYTCVVMRCPVCLTLETVSVHIHLIGQDGTCSPSLVCWRVKGGGCTFHEHVRLAGWDPAIQRTQ